MTKRALFALKLCLLLSVTIMPVIAQDGSGNDDDFRGLNIPYLYSNNALFASAGLGAVLAGVGTWMLTKRQQRGPAFVHYGVIALTVITGIIHFIIGLRGSPLLLANGAGYLVLLVLCYLPLPTLDTYRKPLGLLLTLYTIVTFVGYFILGGSFTDIVGGVTKAVEILLVLLLVMVTLRFPLPRTADMIGENPTFD